MTDQETIAAIEAGGIDKEKAATKLYEALEPYVLNGMKKFRINETLAREAFHLAINKTIQAIEFGQFQGKSKISTYFHPIFFNRCIDILRRESSYKEGDLDDYMFNLPDKAMDILRNIQAQDNLRELHFHLDALGEKCRRLLIDTEWYGKTLTEMAKILDYASASAAGTTKNRCLQKLKSLMNINA
ncbi:MAG: RNA polymerase sigma factor [Bacteroidia bacterium]